MNLGYGTSTNMGIDMHDENARARDTEGRVEHGKKD
ncbi:hypothetical protein PIIN_11164 [Serendipita indica DSM 11827]|uniref:Uncharacterized protein n=1 Tax=Serendipita indica (strain DSM 11827) TaxID=1109443 RepID=G4U0T9_SERID|nr:hypothetical protein PIIN_11164 [Serendipita indica DSM 11827]